MTIFVRVANQHDELDIFILKVWNDFLDLTSKEQNEIIQNKLWDSFGISRWEDWTW